MSDLTRLAAALLASSLGHRDTGLRMDTDVHRLCP